LTSRQRHWQALAFNIAPFFSFGIEGHVVQVFAIGRMAALSGLAVPTKMIVEAHNDVVALTATDPRIPAVYAFNVGPALVL